MPALRLIVAALLACALLVLLALSDAQYNEPQPTSFRVSTVSYQQPATKSTASQTTAALEVAGSAQPADRAPHAPVAPAPPEEPEIDPVLAAIDHALATGSHDPEADVTADGFVNAEDALLWMGMPLDPDAAADPGLSLRIELDESNGDVRILRLIADRNELAMLGVTAGLRSIDRDGFDGDERPMPILQPLDDMTEWSLAYIPRLVGAEAAVTLIEPFFPVAAEGEPTTVAEFALLLPEDAIGVFELRASDDSVFIDDFGRIVPVELEGVEVVVRTSADLDGSGVIDRQDVVTFVRAFGTSAPELDLNGDGRLDRFDFVEVLNMEGAPAVELRPIGGQTTGFGVAAANEIVNARDNAADGQVASGELGAPEARQRGVIDPRRSGLAAGMGRAPAEGRPTFTSELAELDRELIDHIPIPGPRKGQEPTTPPRVDRLTPVAGAWIVDQLGLSELRVGFDQDVTIPQGSVRLWGTRSLQDVAFTSTYDTEVRTLTLTPAAPLRNDRYTLLVDYTVTNAADLALDGEIPQPLAAILPSGDGTEGGQAVFQFNVLQGDATRDGVVDMADRNALLASLGRSEGDPGFNALADLNADGVVNVLDVNILQTNFGQTLGTPDGTPPMVDEQTPAPGTTLRALTLDTVEVTFSEPIEPGRLSRRSLHAVTPAGELRVPDSVALAPDGRVATFTFVGSLADLGLYDFRLSNGVSDPSGELLDLTLWTAALDNAPARLVFSSPFNGEDDVAVTRETIAEFDQPLDRASVSPSAVFGQFGGASLPAMLYQSQSGNRVTLFYSDNLPASARVRVTVDGDQLIDDLGLAADADGDGVPGGIRTLDFDTLSLTEITGTAVCGRVFASELDDDGVTSVDVPLAGVTITVDGREDELFAVTDEMGNFRLEPAPVGRFFVHIDGRTATNADIPEGAYYPFVGKVFKSVAGQETNPKGESVATAGKGEIYLPLVAPDALEPVSQTADTVIGFPQSVIDSFADHPDFQQALLGTSITVPADSLFADDGTRGGQVGIAPVPRDRLPGPLPDGLNIPLVITVQTDGPTNFDVPVPAVFPNLPNPVTGDVREPGDRSMLWSFDHDLGDWVPNGPMTVSEDGSTVVADEGTGVRAPGWHGDRPGMNFIARAEAATTEEELINSVMPPGTRTPQERYRDMASAFRGTMRVLGNTLRLVERVIPGVRNVASQRRRIENALDVAADGDPQSGLELLIDIGSTQTNIKLPRRLKDLSSSLDDLGGVVNGASEVGDRLEEARDKWAGDSRQRAKPTDRLASIDGAIAAIRDVSERLAVRREFLAEAVPFANTAADLLELIDEDSEFPYGLNEQQVSDIFTNLAAFIPLFEELNAEPTPDDDVTTIIASVEVAYQGLYGGLVQSPSRPLYVLIHEIGNDRQFRGTTNDSGEFSMPLSFEGSFEISFLDPTTLLWSRSYARTTLDWLQVLFPNDTRGRSEQRTQRTSGDAPDLSDFGRRFSIPLWTSTMTPAVLQLAEAGGDVDSDLLSDQAEEIVGSFPNNPDSDGDGILDGVELLQGTDPLDGIAVQSGIIASADTSGEAVDIASFGNRTVVANSNSGVSVFNVFLGLNPILVAQVDTPGEATAVAFTSNLVAVADGSAGLTVLDVTDPPAATILHRVAAADLRGSARAVTTAGNIAIVGTSGGTIATVDMVTGAVLDTVVVGPSIQDLAIDGRYAYALTDGTLRSYDFTTGRLVLIDSVGVQTGVPGSALGERSRLSVGGGFAYCSHRQSFSVVDVSDPFTMVRQSVSGELTSQFGWKQLRPNGSGLGIAAVSPNSGFGGPNDVSLYDLEAVVAEGQSISDSFLATFETPGVARAVSIFNGLAYVADNDRGLQVVNYREFDRDGIAPTAAFTVTEFGRRSADLDGNGMLDTTDMALLVDLIASGDLRGDLNGDGQADSADLMLLMDLIDSGEPDPAIDGLVEDGQLLVVEAEVFDDVQVRNVELLIDGEVVQTDGNFPFQFFVNAPIFASPDGTDDPMPFEITVRASDTGGNRTTADPQPLRVQPDRTAPRVLSTEPQQGQEIFDGFFDFFTTGGILLRFSESVILSSDSEISLTAAGADGLFDTSDDTALAFSASSLARETLLVVRPSGMLPVGDVRLYIQDGAIRDSAHNPLDSNSDGAGGGPFVLEFPVVERPSVFWSFEGSGFWDEATKWSSGSVPTSADEVRIDVPGSETITHRSGNSQMFAVVASDAVSVAGGSLGVLERAQFNQLLLSSGDLGGTGSIDLSGPFTWTGGTLSGTGVLTAADGATLGGSAKTADRPVILGGQSVWSSGEITGNASPVRVPAGAELTVLADSVFRSSVSATKRLVNEGTIRHSGSGTTAFSRPIGNGGNGVLDNRGTVVIESGEIEHQVPGGRNAGTITVQSGAVLDLRQSFTHEPGSVIDGNGAIEFTSGTHDLPAGSFDLRGRVDFIEGTVTINNVITPAEIGTFSGSTVRFNTDQSFAIPLILSSGDLGGSGDIGLTGPFTWTGGTLSGSGVLTAAAGATLGGSDKNANRPVVLGGQSVWSAGEIRGDSSPVTVPAGAELTVSASSLFRSDVSATKRLVNEGTIRHSGSGTTAFSRPIGNGGNGVLDNRGTVVIESGEIEHQVPGGRNAGTITVQSGAVLDLRQSFTHEPGSVIDGDGAVAFGETHTFRIRDVATFARVAGSGELSLAGSLAVSVDPSYSPSLDDRFPIIQRGTVTGGFSNSVNLDLGEGLRLQSQVEPDGNVVLIVTTN